MPAEQTLKSFLSLQVLLGFISKSYLHEAKSTGTLSQSSSQSFGVEVKQIQKLSEHWRIFFLIIGCSGDFPVWQPRPKSFENLTRLLQLWSSTIFLSGPHSMLLASYTTPKQQQGNNHVGDKQAQCSVGVILLVFGTFTLYS